MENNPVGWFEIYVQDMSRARSFYEQVLGLTLQPLDMPDIEMLAFPMDSESTGSGGALIKVPGVPSGPGGTMVYFSCVDCAVEAERAASNGGSVERSKMQVGEYGFVAIIRDPDGNMLGLHSQN